MKIVECKECGIRFKAISSTYKRCPECIKKERLINISAIKKLSEKLKARENLERLFNKHSICKNFNNINLTCIRCLENGEEKYRGCFNKSKKRA